MVRSAYFALASNQLLSDLDNVAGFINKVQYPSPMRALESEWGAAGNLRFLTSSIGSVTQNASVNGADVYNVFCVGKITADVKSSLIDLELLNGQQGASFIAA